MSNKWNRSLGTSKREQGIATAPSPNHPKRRIEFLTGREAKAVYVDTPKKKKEFKRWE